VELEHGRDVTLEPHGKEERRPRTGPLREAA
jgi:hypothetical protein